MFIFKKCLKCIKRAVLPNILLLFLVTTKFLANNIICVATSSPNEDSSIDFAKYDAVNAYHLFNRKVCLFELNELKQKHPEMLTQNLDVFKNLNIINSGNVDKDSEVMFSKVKAFLENMGDQTRENFVLAHNNCLSIDTNNEPQKTMTATSKEFSDLEKNPDYAIFYRGFGRKSDVERVRQGLIRNSDFDSDLRARLNPDFGGMLSPLITTPFYSVASMQAVDENENGNITGEYGEVVRFALNRNAKVVSKEYLKEIFDNMIKKHSEYFKDYLNFVKIHGGNLSSLTMLEGFADFADFVKVKTGFNFFADIDKKTYDERLTEFLKRLYGIFGLKLAKNNGGQLVAEDSPILSKLTPEQEQAIHEMNNIFEKHRHNSELRLFHPVSTLSRDYELLAKLMGYDAFAFQPSWFDLAEMCRNGKDFMHIRLMAEPVLNIVKFDNITVCSDEFDLKQKLGLESVFDLIKQNPYIYAKRPYDVERSLKMYSGNLSADADVMFEKIKEFLETAEKQGVDEKGLADYSLNYIKKNVNSGHEKIISATSEHFKQFENNPDYLILFRGIHEKPYYESARRGEVYIGGPVRGSKYNLPGLGSNGAQEGSGIYTTSAPAYAIPYARLGSDCDFGDGVIKFALPKNSKFVSVDYLHDVFEEMLRKHSDYSPFKKYIEFKKTFPNNWLYYSSSFLVDAEFVKQKTGFDFFADLDNKPAQEREECFRKKESIIEFYGNRVGSFGLKLMYLEDWSKDIAEIAKTKGIAYEPVGPDFPEDYIMDKVCFLSLNYGLLAKLMGFDVVCSTMYSRPVPDVFTSKLSLYTPIESCFNIVDYSNLVVCSEPFELLLQSNFN